MPSKCWRAACRGNVLESHEPPETFAWELTRDSPVEAFLATPEPPASECRCRVDAGEAHWEQDEPFGPITVGRSAIPAQEAVA